MVGSNRHYLNVLSIVQWNFQWISACSASARIKPHTSFCTASARTRYALRNEAFSSSASSAWSAASWSSATRRTPCVRSARCWTSAHDRSVCAYSPPCLRHFDLPVCPFGFLQVKRRMVTCATLRESRQIARIWLVAITNKVIANEVYRWIVRGVFLFRSTSRPTAFSHTRASCKMKFSLSPFLLYFFFHLEC